MGRWKRGGRRGRGGGGRGRGHTEGNGQDKRDNRTGYVLRPLENEQFENYYKNQGFVPEGEWDAFMGKLRQSLPSTFRITGSRSQAKEVLNIIRGEYFSKLMEVEIEGRTIQPPTCLPWYPDEMAWQINLDRKFIRKSEALKKLHTFLVSETESGNISRQEAVSMIPPLLLDIKPHHRVLDMCAAPGSKTAQLIEHLHAQDPHEIPAGFVVANDVDNKRCYLMVHQVKRLESPNFMIINHDASQLPNMRTNAPDSPEKVWLNYDRVLADVPCSGDGTMRKNPDVWYKWNPGAAHNLHGIQNRILKRGIELLEVGGRLVYSTCSFNPIEDEAVVAHMLQKCQGCMELVDVSSELPGLKFISGLHSWKVMTRQGEWFSSYEEVPERLHTQIRQSMFPPPMEVANSLGLSKCMRILPHHQDTGGFFIAVLRKVQQVPWFKQRPAPGEEQSEPSHKPESQPEPEPEQEGVQEQDGKGGPAVEDATDPGSTLVEGAPPDSPTDSDPGQKRKSSDESERPPKKKPKLFGYKEDPFVYLDEDELIWPPIKEFFDIIDDFPVTQLMVRCNQGKKRNIYFTSKIIKDLVQFNQDRVKFINLGMKVLSRSDSPHVTCDFRLVQEGMNIMFPFLMGRRVTISKEDIITLLSQENPFLYKMTEPARNQLNLLSQGGMIFIYDPLDSEAIPQCQLIFCGWKGKTSSRSFLPKHDRAHFLRLCGVELKSKEEKEMEKRATGVSQEGEEGEEAEQTKTSTEPSETVDARNDEQEGDKDSATCHEEKETDSHGIEGEEKQTDIDNTDQSMKTCMTAKAGASGIEKMDPVKAEIGVVMETNKAVEERKVSNELISNKNTETATVTLEST